jgi:hypothetical protein
MALTYIALQSLYPELQEAWQRRKSHTQEVKAVAPKKIYKPPGYWKNLDNQRAFFDRLATKLNIQKPEDWMNVSHYDVMQERGFFIKTYYNSSVVKGSMLYI